MICFLNPNASASCGGNIIVVLLEYLRDVYNYYSLHLRLGAVNCKCQYFPRIDGRLMVILIRRFAVRSQIWSVYVRFHTVSI